MILQEIFNNHFEFLIPEFFLATILLSLLLFGVLFKKNQKNQLLLIVKNVNTITIYLLFILLILIFKIPFVSKIYLNNLILIDSLTQLIKIILVISTLFCLLIQQKFLIKFKIHFYEIIILILISLLGLILLVSTNNFILLYLAIELQSLSFYILTASQRQSIFSIEAALKYFILGSIASSFILFGSSIFYGITGSLSFNHLFLILTNIDFIKYPDLLYAFLYGFLFIISGICFKIGIAPFHFWLPDVYEGSPNSITAFFAIVPKTAFWALLIRFYFFIFSDLSFFFEFFFLIIALLSMIIGSLSALQQKKFKRLLAYSSISHTGFILIGFASNSLNNIPFILLYIIIYVIININLWTSYLCLEINDKPIKYLTDLSNFFYFNKLLSLIIMINFFSLAGIPPLAGFFSKFFIFFSGIQNKSFMLIFFALLISIVSLFYYLKIIKILFFEKVIKKSFISPIQKIESLVLVFNTQIIIFFFLFSDLFLMILNKTYLKLLL